MDVRGYDELRALAELDESFARDLWVEQVHDKSAHLRDFAVAHHAFVYAGIDPADYATLAAVLGDGPLVFGWGGDEHRWVESVSAVGGAGIPADWSRNLSVLEQLPVPLSERPRKRPQPVQDGERIVAFVMSDGDNIQRIGGRLAVAEGFWASPHRGAFSMTWEMAPVLAEVARRTAFYMARSDLSVATMLNSGGDMTQSAELLEQPEVMGVLYKDYAPYNAREGQVFWYAGKPCVSYRYLLWEPQPANSPEAVAAAIARQPAAPATDQDSYALINVHAWSYRDIGGPMEAVRQTVDLLPAGTRVVTAEELVILLRDNFGTPVVGTGP